MIALAADWTEGPRSNLFRWLVPASVALHFVVFTWLPSATRHHFDPPAPLVIEVAEPPPAAPPEPAPEPLPAAPTAIATPTPAAPRTTAARAVHDAPAERSTTTEAPMDFTSTVFSNDGPGVAVSAGAGPVATGPAAVVPRATTAPAPARLVPPSSLARRPRAPGLDAELERQYPADARRSGISGTAALRVRILPDGRIGDVHVVSESWAGFGPACERTVRAARWEPPIDHDGTPVTTEITYTCRFEVRN